ncbi:MAG: hypothetical protein IPG10_20760, partial [Flavobacteriales bacterium]|nr:hypothetical protein [Flavobacteriales bacterium]
PPQPPLWSPAPGQPQHLDLPGIRHLIVFIFFAYSVWTIAQRQKRL